MKIKKRQLRKYTPVENIQLIQSGEHYFHILEKLIAEATTTLHFQMYIFDPDDTGRRIVNALKAASARGVKVTLLLDAFGSQKLHGKWKDEIVKAGIAFRKF